METTYKRTRFYFKNSPQGKYILSCFLIAGMVAVLYSFLLIFLSKDTLSLTYGQNGLTLAATPSVLKNSILSIHGILVLGLGAFILYTVTWYTHRSAGPIYKINQTLDSMARGDFSKTIYLRKHDEHKDMAENINRLNDTLNKKIREIETLSRTLDHYLMGDDIKTTPLLLAIDKQKPYSHPLVMINETLKENLSFFTTSHHPKV